MKPIDGYYEQQTTEDTGRSYPRLSPGKYVAQITDVANNEDQSHLIVHYDIAEGDCAGHFARMAQRYGTAYNDQRVYYTPASVPFFRRFVTAIELSNPSFNWAWNEDNLIGKKVGIVLNTKEYRAKDGKIKTCWTVDRWIPVDALDAETMPEPRKQKPLDGPGGYADNSADDDEIGDELPY